MPTHAEGGVRPGERAIRTGRRQAAFDRRFTGLRSWRASTCWPAAAFGVIEKHPPGQLDGWRALRALADGLQLDLDTPAAAETSAAALAAVLHDAAVTSDVDARTDKQLLRISRRQHGNVKLSVITQDFCTGPTTKCWRVRCDLQRAVDTRCGGRARRG